MALQTNTCAESAKQVFVLVTPQCSFISALLVMEPLQAANRVSGREHFKVSLTSIDGEPVVASNGIKIPVVAKLSNVHRSSIVCVIASYEQPKLYKSQLTEKLRRAARHGAALWGIDLGVVLLAEAGLISGVKVSVHWEVLPAFREKWPEIEACDELYSHDGHILTCGGLTAALDMIVAYIAFSKGHELARSVSNELLMSGFRPSNTAQRHLDTVEPWSENSILSKAVSIMTSRIDDPVSIAELARTAKVSKRQLEYLSQRYMRCTLRQFYLNLRLQRARELLLYTEAPILEVASATGFSSAAVLSRAFGKLFTIPPTIYRARFKTSLSRPYHFPIHAA